MIAHTLTARVVDQTQLVCSFGSCTVATGLTTCPHLNGQRVCVPAGQLSAREAAVQAALQQYKTGGPRCVEGLVPLMCHLHIPLCTPGADNEWQVSVDVCDRALSRCNLPSNTVQRTCSHLSLAPHSPIARRGVTTMTSGVVQQAQSAAVRLTKPSQLGTCEC